MTKCLSILVQGSFGRTPQILKKVCKKVFELSLGRLTKGGLGFLCVALLVG